MATMQGITGKLSGKMGSAVFRVREGQQVVAQYNPIVKNPNTEGQQAQRAKFKLMSQLAAIMERGFGSFIIKTRPEKGKPSQRNAFVSKNFGLVTVADEASGVTAKIPMEQLQLTSSFRTLPPLTTEGDVNSLTVSMSDIPEDVALLRIILVEYPERDTKQASIKNIVDVPVSDNSISHNFESLPEGDYTVLAYGLIPSESALSSIDLDNIHTPADEDFISAVKLDAMVAAGEMAETMTVGTNATV